MPPRARRVRAGQADRVFRPAMECRRRPRVMESEAVRPSAARRRAPVTTPAMPDGVGIATRAGCLGPNTTKQPTAATIVTVASQTSGRTSTSAATKCGAGGCGHCKAGSSAVIGCGSCKVAVGKRWLSIRIKNELRRPGHGAAALRGRCCLLEVEQVHQVADSRAVDWDIGVGRPRQEALLRRLRPDGGRKHPEADVSSIPDAAQTRRSANFSRL